jgi:hypothetical protein
MRGLFRSYDARAKENLTASGSALFDYFLTISNGKSALRLESHDLSSGEDRGCNRGFSGVIPTIEHNRLSMSGSPCWRQLTPMVTAYRCMLAEFAILMSSSRGCRLKRPLSESLGSANPHVP